VVRVNVDATANIYPHITPHEAAQPSIRYCHLCRRVQHVADTGCLTSWHWRMNWLDTHS